MHMSESLPENPFSGISRVVKLITGEEILGLVRDTSDNKIEIKFPAKLEVYNLKSENNEVIECVKLTNYISNVKNFEIAIPRNSIVYLGYPTSELEKMYETFVLTMQTDPKSVAGSTTYNSNPEAGLSMLNELFTNPDFVDFVNDLIDNFEGVEIIMDEEEDIEDASESPLNDIKEEAPIPEPKPKKKRKAKPEGNKLPYDPEANPNDPKSWSNNPEDYL